MNRKPLTEEENASFKEQAARAFARIHSDALARLEGLIPHIDAEYAFQALASSSLRQMAMGFNEAKHGAIPALMELAAFYLYPRFGIPGSRDPDAIQVVIDALWALDNSRDLHTAFSMPQSNKPEQASIQVHLRLAAERVRGSAYPPQIKKQIYGIQCPFDNWFKTRLKLSPTRALAILDAFELALEENGQAERGHFRELETLRETLRALPTAALKEESAKSQFQKFCQLTEDIPLWLAVSFDQILAKIPDIQKEEWNALRDLIGLTPATRQNAKEISEIKERPIFFLSNDRMIIISISSVYDALFDVFDKHTRSSPEALTFRDKSYIHNLSSWMEDEVRASLSHVFPKESIYKQLCYPDPDHPKGEAELDGLVTWGPFLMLIEVKGKGFSPKSKSGNLKQLRRDLENNIQDAFDQTSRALRFIDSSPAVTFKEKEKGRRLQVKKAYFQRIFLLSVTLHNFIGLTTQLATLKALGLFKESVYPLSLSLGDLDIICRFSETPDILLHYTQRRMELQNSGMDIVGDELDLFGHYLDTRLDPTQYWKRKDYDGSTPTRISLSGASARFDEWYRFERGALSEKPRIGIDLPPRILEIITFLRTQQDDDSKAISFGLLGLTHKGLMGAENALTQGRAKAKRDGKFLRISFKDNDLVISIVTCDGIHPEILSKYVLSHNVLEKYRHRSTSAMAIGVDISDLTYPFKVASWLESPWTFNPALDQFLKEQRSTFAPGQKLPGRNDPCFCGSEIKFKKCCLPRIIPS